MLWTYGEFVQFCCGSAVQQVGRQIHTTNRTSGDWAAYPFRTSAPCRVKLETQGGGVENAEGESMESHSNNIMECSYITHLISPRLSSSHLTSFHLLWMLCNWSQPRQTGSRAPKRCSPPCQRLSWVIYNIYCKKFAVFLDRMGY